MVNEFCGFKHGVIGTDKMPADTTLNNMKKADLIKLLHTAQHNYESLMWFYNNAVKANMSQLNNNGWIACSERLPRIGEQVMVCNRYGSVFVSHITYLNPKITTNGECNDFGSHYDVIAWQPLPAPYQPKSETKLYERKSNAGEYTDYTGEWV